MSCMCECHSDREGERGGRETERPKDKKDIVTLTYTDRETQIDNKKEKAFKGISTKAMLFLPWKH